MANQFVVYQDDRHGLGSWVAEQIAADLFRNKVALDDQAQSGVPTGPAQVVPDAKPNDQKSADATSRLVSETYGLSLSAGGRQTALFGDASGNTPSAPIKTLDQAYRTWTSPRAGADTTMASVMSQQAQVAVLPLYDTDLAFNTETLNALIDFPATNIVREYVAESNYVLAAPSDLVHEIEQAGFSNSFDETGTGKSFSWNRQKQQRFLRRVTTIYASPDAMTQCAAALEGFRAQGIEVRLVPDGIDVYREGLRLSSEMLDPHRRVQTVYANNEHKRISSTRAANHNKGLIAVMLSADKATRDSGFAYDNDYVVLESEMAGADRIRTAFVALTKGKPPVVSGNQDPVRFEIDILSKKLGLGGKHGGKGGVDSRPLYPMPQDKKRAAAGGTPPAPPFIRALYMVNTTGPKAKDISPIIKELTEAGFSYTTTSMTQRPGHPMIFAVDVSADRLDALRPALRHITKLGKGNYRQLGAFPAVQPMIKEAIRPQPQPGWQRYVGVALMLAAIAILGVTAMTVLGSMTPPDPAS